MVYVEFFPVHLSEKIWITNRSDFMIWSKIVDIVMHIFVDLWSDFLRWYYIHVFALRRCPPNFSKWELLPYGALKPVLRRYFHLCGQSPSTNSPIRESASCMSFLDAAYEHRRNSAPQPPNTLPGTTATRFSSINRSANSSAVSPVPVIDGNA